VRLMAVLLTAVFLAAFAAFGALVVETKEAHAASTVRTCTGGTVSLKTIERTMLAQHNRARAERGLPRLCVHPKLQKSARAHSADMIQRDYFSHNTKGRNEGPCKRIRRYGYRWRKCGENSAWGSGRLSSPNSRFQAWMNSSGHRANILNRGFREVGIGAARGTFRSSSNVTMWTVDFGDR
jgi:uncharacterized protein YkwD